jgi:uncharacterized protein
MPMLDSSYERLHPNTRIVWIINGLIGVGVLMLIGGVVEMALSRDRRIELPWPAIVPGFTLMLGAIAAVWSITLSILQFARFGYTLRPADLIVASGVIWRARRCIPRARIQHVDIDSGPIDRAFGLVDVSLYVAGGMGPVARINGLSPEAAEHLKEALIVERTDGV